MRAGIESVRARAQRWSIEVEGDTVETLFLPRVDEAPDEPSASLARLVRAEGLENTIGALVYPVALRGNRGRNKFGCDGFGAGALAIKVQLARIDLELITGQHDNAVLAKIADLIAHPVARRAIARPAVELFRLARTRFAVQVHHHHLLRQHLQARLGHAQFLVQPLLLRAAQHFSATAAPAKPAQ